MPQRKGKQVHWKLKQGGFNIPQMDTNYHESILCAGGSRAGSSFRVECLEFREPKGVEARTLEAKQADACRAGGSGKLELASPVSTPVRKQVFIVFCIFPDALPL